MSNEVLLEEHVEGPESTYVSRIRCPSCTQASPLAAEFQTQSAQRIRHTHREDAIPTKIPNNAVSQNAPLTSTARSSLHHPTHAPSLNKIKPRPPPLTPPHPLIPKHNPTIPKPIHHPRNPHPRQKPQRLTMPQPVPCRGVENHQLRGPVLPLPFHDQRLIARRVGDLGFERGLGEVERCDDVVEVGELGAPVGVD